MSMPATRPSLTRLLLIDAALREDTYPSLGHLADTCEVHERTVKRDLQCLRNEFQAPIRYSREKRGFYYAQPFSLSPPPIAEGDLFALCMMTAIAPIFKKTPYWDCISRTLSKLKALLPEEVQLNYFDRAAVMTCFTEPTPPVTALLLTHVKQLADAISQSRQVYMVYYSLSTDRTMQRTIDPYHLYYRRGTWYVHGWCHLRKERRDFAVARIRELDILPYTFSPPDLGAICDELANRFSIMHDQCMEVAIWFDAETARLIRERVWHPSQAIVQQSDGSCILTMRVDGIQSVTRWVLGFGRHALPLAPAALVQMLNDELAGMTALRAGRRSASSSMHTGSVAPRPGAETPRG